MKIGLVVGRFYTGLVGFLGRHKNVNPDGTKSTPTTNSLIVLPREILAINSPTNGDQESHQVLYKSVQPPSQFSFLFVAFIFVLGNTTGLLKSLVENCYY